MYISDLVHQLAVILEEPLVVTHEHVLNALLTLVERSETARTDARQVLIPLQFNQDVSSTILTLLSNFAVFLGNFKIQTIISKFDYENALKTKMINFLPWYLRFQNCL